MTIETSVEATSESTAAAPPRSQFVRFIFFKVRPDWYALPAAARQQASDELSDLLARWSDRCMVRTYSLVGFRHDVDLMVWLATEDPVDLHEFGTALAASTFGRHADIPQSFLSMTKHSSYVKNHRETRPNGHRLRLAPGDAAYLFVYPFVKTRAWYALPLAERQAMMNEHIRVGTGFPSVKINTTYSFGLDDQEFVVAFETDEPRDFLDLVMALRETKASAYTLRDTPMYTCKRATTAEVVAMLAAT